MKTVFVGNEWSPLKDVVIGIVPEMRFSRPGIHVLKGGSLPVIRLIDRVVGSLLQGRKMPRWMRNAFRKEAIGLKKELLKFSVKVREPEAVQPRKKEEPGLSQIFPRDLLAVIGNRVICCKPRVKTLRKEKRGLEPILLELKETGAAILDEPEGENTFLEGGDILVDLPNVFVGIGRHGSNLEGAEWLSARLGPSIEVVPIKIIHQGIFHLDTCMTIIGHRQGIICRGVLEDPLPAPLSGYEFVEVDKKARMQLAANVLMLNEKTIVVQRRHRDLVEQLSQRSFNVINLNFSWHAASGGGFRCATMPLRRDP